VILTGTIFALIKLSPVINILAGKLAAQLLGYPTAYLLDPTDLIALIVLYGSWYLWLHPPKIQFRNLRMVAFALAAFSVIATSPQLPPPVFNRLIVVDGVLYIVGYQSGFPNDPIVAKSTVGGLVWDQVSPQDMKGLPYAFEPPTIPHQICLPEDPFHCFRITGSETIEMSEDGGQTWGIAWRPPPGRRYFMDRYVQGGLSIFSDPIIIDSGPYDLVLYDQRDKTYLLAAMGNEGVLRRALPSGEWERIAVLWAKPTPYGVNDWSASLWILRYEIGLWILFAGGALIWVCTRAWDVVKQHDSHVKDLLVLF
jgi:hypothetical protein